MPSHLEHAQDFANRAQSDLVDRTAEGKGPHGATLAERDLIERAKMHAMVSIAASLDELVAHAKRQVKS